MEKTPLKFRKYTNKEDFNEARSNQEISEGDITFVSGTKEVFVGPNTKYVKRSNNRGGVVIVDKIFHGDRAILSDRVPNGYRYGVCKTQKIYVALAEIFNNKREHIYTRYVIDPMSNLLINTDSVYFTWDSNITASVDLTNNLNWYTWNLYLKYNLDIFFGSTNWDGNTSEHCFLNHFLNNSRIETNIPICGSDDGNIGYKYKYVALYKAWDRTGYFEKINNTWKFYPCNLMIGNNGTVEIKNNKIISKSLAYNISNQYLTYDKFLSLLREIELYYRKEVNLKIQTTYSLYVKLRKKHIKCHHDCLNRVPKKWFKVYNNCANNIMMAVTIDKINIFTLYKCIVPWNNGIQNRFPGKVLYKYNKETNQIDKYFIVKYLDFKVGKHGNKKYGPEEDENCISFRAYFTPTGVNIEIKNAADCVKH